MSPFDGVFLSNRGIFIPGIDVEGLPAAFWLSLLITLVTLIVVLSRRLLTGPRFYLSKVAAILLAVFSSILRCSSPSASPLLCNGRLKADSISAAGFH